MSAYTDKLEVSLWRAMTALRALRKDYIAAYCNERDDSVKRMLESIGRNFDLFQETTFAHNVFKAVDSQARY